MTLPMVKELVGLVAQVINNIFNISNFKTKGEYTND